MPQRYYYCDGKKIPLKLATAYIAICGADGIPVYYSNPSLEKKIKTQGTLLPRRGWVLLKANLLTDEEINLLKKAGAINNVYRIGKTLMVPAPEVRVEWTEKHKLDVFRALATTHIRSWRIEVEEEDRLVLYMIRDGKGDDALDLANYIFEKAHPLSSSARMMQVISKDSRP
jgi:hypothetical protein